MPIIQYDNVCKKFDNSGRLAVDHVSARIEKGEFITILGSSGCGKTTLLKLTNRLYDPDEGKVLVDGEDIAKADPVACEAAKGIGMTDMQILTRIRIPLARKAIFAGIRLAVVSTVGIATIAASINAGGLGILLFEGLRTMNIPKILWGSVLSAGMAVLLNAVLKMMEERM